MTKQAKDLINWITTSPEKPLDAVVASNVLALPPLEMRAVLQEVADALVGPKKADALRSLEAAAKRVELSKRRVPRRK